MAETSQSAYTILGVSKASSEKEIKTAYVNLVKKYDPEKHTDRFMIIQRAYDRLKTVKNRALEDVYTYNSIKGDYHFQPEEKSDTAPPPTEEDLKKMREEYNKDPLNDVNKQQFCKMLFQSAHSALRKKQLVQAIDAWREVLDADPSHSRARQNLLLASSGLAYSYALHGLHEEAIELWEQALAMNPDNTEVIHNLALVAERNNQPVKAGKFWGEAVARWKQMLEREPDNEYLRNCIIEALNHHGEYLDEHQVEIRAAEGRELLRREAEKKARQPLPKIAKDGPDEPEAKGPTASRPEVPKVVAPGSSQTRAASSRPRANIPKPTSAPQPIVGSNTLDRYREILKLKPEDFDAHFQLCSKLMEEQMYQEAQKELMDLARKHTKNTEVLNMLGWSLLNTGQKDMAFNAWKKSLSIDPSNSDTREQMVRAHLAMGKAFRQKGLFTQALVHFKQLIQLMPRNAEVHLEIAATYDMKGDTRSAVHEYNRVLALDPKNQVARKAITDLRMKR